MARKGLSLKGFDELLDNIQRAGGNLNKVANEATEAGMQAMQEALIAECNASHVPSKLIGEIKIKKTVGNDRYEGSVGWIVPTYDPRQPAAAYKVMFLNYGTPKRYTKSGKYTGKITERGFIQRGKKRGSTRLKRAQKEALNKILEDLKR